MKFSLNEVKLVGRLTKDVELQYTAGGSAVAKFSLATDRSWKDKESNEYKKVTQFHSVVAWGNLAEQAAKHLSKGVMTMLVGRIEYRKHQDKSYTDIILEDFIPMKSSNVSQTTKEEEDTNDIPF